jgi:hypothetical protein
MEKGVEILKSSLNLNFMIIVFNLNGIQIGNANNDYRSSAKTVKRSVLKQKKGAYTQK